MYSIPRGRQEEQCDTGVTLSNNGSICCLHPAAFCYFLSLYIIILTNAEKIFLLTIRAQNVRIFHGKNLMSILP